MHVIRGKRRSITYQEGFFTDLVGAGTSGRQFCNWRIDFVDYNSSGKVNRRSRGPIHRGCTILENGRKASADRTAAKSTVKVVRGTLQFGHAHCPSVSPHLLIGAALCGTCRS